MQIIEPVVRANVLSKFDNVVANYSVDPAPLLAAVGLSSADITDPDRYISLNTVAELFELAAKRTKDALFGLQYATEFPAGGSGLLGHLMLTSPTVGDVLKVIEDYLEVHALSMRTKLAHQGGVYSLYVGYPATFTAPHMQYTAFLLTALVMRLRLGAGQSWCPYAVEFAHRAPDNLKAYQRYFGTRLTFDALRYRFDVDEADMAKPMPKLMEGLAKTVRAQGDLVLAETRTRYDVVGRTFLALSDSFANEQPFDLEAIAKSMDLPVRALQWRLEQAGTSYERLLARTRSRIAVHLLRDTDQPIAIIAMRLGYSETSAFTRATQNWFKESPSVMRRRLREGGPDDGPAGPD